MGRARSTRGAGGRQPLPTPWPIGAALAQALCHSHTIDCDVHICTDYYDDTLATQTKVMTKARTTASASPGGRAYMTCVNLIVCLCDF